MLVDLHAHTSAISPCCQRTAEEVFAEAKEKGIDGLVVSNHYDSGYFDEGTYHGWIERYIEEVERCKKVARSLNMKCFFGVEVTMEYDKRLHLLIYGADGEFLRKNPYLSKMSQRQLFEACNAWGAALVQAHPFRYDVGIRDTRYLHGVEINCHPLYGDSHAGEVLAAAGEKNLAVTVGCDYHGDTYRPSAGSVLPDELDTDGALAAFIRAQKVFPFQIHEPKTGEISSGSFTRK